MRALRLVSTSRTVLSARTSTYRNRSLARSFATDVNVAAVARELKLPDDLLHMFPDLARISNWRREGKLKQALETVISVSDILVNATGPSSVQSKSILRLRTALQFESFDDKASIQSILDIKKSFPEVDEFQVDGLMLLSAHRLVCNDLPGAMEAAEAAVESCEDTDATPGAPVHCFSPAYGIKGLVHLLRGEVEEADTYLQMSARWSQSLAHTVAALNNLGSLYWLLGPAHATHNSSLSPGTSPPVSFDVQRQQQDFTQLPISKYNNRYTSEDASSSHNNGSGSGNGSSGQLSQADIDRIRTAAEYWTEAVALLTDSSSSSVSSAAASMCGGSSGAESSTKNVLSPDDSVQYHSFSSNSGTNKSSSSSGGEVSSSMQAGKSIHSGIPSPSTPPPSLAVAVSGALCNLAEAHNTLGELDRATERLSDALKLLQTVQPEDPYGCAPALGRVLGLLAYQSMYSSQAVTAEGLFRASLDHLQKNPLSAARDCRLRYELAVVRGRQGLLLSKWDKREKEGLALISSSESALASEYAIMDTHDSNRRRILLTMSLQIPYLI